MLNLYPLTKWTVAGCSVSASQILVAYIVTYLSAPERTYDAYKHRWKIMEEEMSPMRIELYVHSVEVPAGGPGRTLFHCDECEIHC